MSCHENEVNSINTPCAICESPDEPTREHILPQTLLIAWGLDPDAPNLARFRTWLCKSCNQRMGRIHDRPDMRRFIMEGHPPTKKSVRELADWIVWVTMLLGVAGDSGVWPNDSARRYLLKRFTERDSGGLPKGVRVWAALFKDDTERTIEESHAVALREDPRVIYNFQEVPIGFSSGSNLAAAKYLGVGKLSLLVLGPTLLSGPDHYDQLDSIVTTTGLIRIHPPKEEMPILQPLTVDWRSIQNIFTADPIFSSNHSLLPQEIRSLIKLMGA